MNECPKYQTLAVMDEEEAQDFIDSGDLDENTSYVEPDEGDQLSCVLQKYLLTPKSPSAALIVQDKLHG